MTLQHARIPVCGTSLLASPACVPPVRHVMSDSDGGDNGSSNNEAAVIGGAVGGAVGGVLLLSLVVGVALFIKKRRRQPKQAQIEAGGGPGAKESQGMAFPTIHSWKWATGARPNLIFPEPPQLAPQGRALQPYSSALHSPLDQGLEASFVKSSNKDKVSSRPWTPVEVRHKQNSVPVVLMGWPLQRILH